MKAIEKIIRKLAPKKYAIFVSGDPGVVTLQEDLKKFKLQKLKEGEIEQKEYENANGVFLRFSVANVIHSGIIQTEDENDSRSLLLTIPPELREEGAKILTILKTPLDRIPMFPFFTILGRSELKELKKNLSQQYWASFSDDVEALKKWHLDFIKFRREMIRTEVPQLEPAVPAWLGSLKVYILYNEEDRIIAKRYYRSLEKDDEVFVTKTSESIALKAEKAFSKAFILPPKQNALSESIQFSKEGEKVYSNWDHPYFSAVEDLKTQVERFNRAQPGVLCNAYKISRTLAYNWTYQEIRKIRELAISFPALKKSFQQWLQPIQALVFYFIDNPIKGRITDGIITAYYINGPEDKIIVEKMENRDAVKWNEDLVRQYFPESRGEIIFGFTSRMLHYLSDKLGTDY